MRISNKIKRMKKITQEEFNGLKFKPKGKEYHQVIQQILFLNIGEGVTLSATEWPLKQAPNAYFYANSDKFNGMFFKARKLLDGGYAIIRVS